MIFTYSGSWTDQEKNTVTSVIVSNTINAIADNAFANSTALKSISIPKSVQSLGNNVFENCTNLEIIYIYNENITLGTDVFLNTSPDLIIYTNAGPTMFTGITVKSLPYSEIIDFYVPTGISVSSYVGLTQTAFTERFDIAIYIPTYYIYKDFLGNYNAADVYLESSSGNLYTTATNDLFLEKSKHNTPGEFKINVGYATLFQPNADATYIFKANNNLTIPTDVDLSTVDIIKHYFVWKILDKPEVVPDAIAVDEVIPYARAFRDVFSEQNITFIETQVNNELNRFIVNLGKVNSVLYGDNYVTQYSIFDKHFQVHIDLKVSPIYSSNKIYGVADDEGINAHIKEMTEEDDLRIELIVQIPALVEQILSLADYNAAQVRSTNLAISTTTSTIGDTYADDPVVSETLTTMQTTSEQLLANSTASNNDPLNEEVALTVVDDTSSLLSSSQTLIESTSAAVIESDPTIQEDINTLSVLTDTVNATTATIDPETTDTTTVDQAIDETNNLINQLDETTTQTLQTGTEDVTALTSSVSTIETSFSQMTDTQIQNEVSEVTTIFTSVSSLYNQILTDPENLDGMNTIISLNDETVAKIDSTTTTIDSSVDTSQVVVNNTITNLQLLEIITEMDSFNQSLTSDMTDALNRLTLIDTSGNEITTAQRDLIIVELKDLLQLSISNTIELIYYTTVVLYNMPSSTTIDNYILQLQAYSAELEQTKADLLADANIDTVNAEFVETATNVDSTTTEITAAIGDGNFYSGGDSGYYGDGDGAIPRMYSYSRGDGNTGGDGNVTVEEKTFDNSIFQTTDTSSLQILLGEIQKSNSFNKQVMKINVETVTINQLKKVKETLVENKKRIEELKPKLVFATTLALTRKTAATQLTSLSKIKEIKLEKIAISLSSLPRVKLNLNANTLTQSHNTAIDTWTSSVSNTEIATIGNMNRTIEIKNVVLNENGTLKVTLELIDNILGMPWYSTELSDWNDYNFTKGSDIRISGKQYPWQQTFIDATLSSDYVTPTVRNADGNWEFSIDNYNYESDPDNYLEIFYNTPSQHSSSYMPQTFGRLHYKRTLRNKDFENFLNSQYVYPSKAYVTQANDKKLVALSRFMSFKIPQYQSSNRISAFIVYKGLNPGPIYFGFPTSMKNTTLYNYHYYVKKWGNHRSLVNSSGLMLSPLDTARSENAGIIVNHEHRILDGYYCNTINQYPQTIYNTPNNYIDQLEVMSVVQNIDKTYNITFRLKSGSTPFYIIEHFYKTLDGYITISNKTNYMGITNNPDPTTYDSSLARNWDYNGTIHFSQIPNITYSGMTVAGYNYATGENVTLNNEVNLPGHHFCFEFSIGNIPYDMTAIGFNFNSFEHGKGFALSGVPINNILYIARRYQWEEKLDTLTTSPYNDVSLMSYVCTNITGPSSIVEKVGYTWRVRNNGYDLTSNYFENPRLIVKSSTQNQDGTWNVFFVYLSGKYPFTSFSWRAFEYCLESTGYHFSNLDNIKESDATWYNCLDLSNTSWVNITRTNYYTHNFTLSAVTYDVTKQSYEFYCQGLPDNIKAVRFKLTANAYLVEYYQSYQHIICGDYRWKNDVNASSIKADYETEKVLDLYYNVWPKKMSACFLGEFKLYDKAFNEADIPATEAEVIANWPELAYKLPSDHPSYKPKVNLVITYQSSYVVNMLKDIKLLPTINAFEPQSHLLFTIDTDLPKGLYFNRSTGAIYGFCEQLFPNTSITVTAISYANISHVASSTFNFQVITWLVNTEPFSVKYDSNLLLGYNVEITSANYQYPNVLGDVQSYELASGVTLPAGLSLDSSTGYIYGTPTVVQDLTTYQLVANGLTTQKTFTVGINIKDISNHQSFAKFIADASTIDESHKWVNSLDYTYQYNNQNDENKRHIVVTQSTQNADLTWNVTFQARGGGMGFDSGKVYFLQISTSKDCFTNDSDIDVNFNWSMKLFTLTKYNWTGITDSTNYSIKLNQKVNLLNYGDSYEFSVVNLPDDVVGIRLSVKKETDEVEDNPTGTNYYKKGTEATEERYAITCFYDKWKNFVHQKTYLNRIFNVPKMKLNYSNGLNSLYFGTNSGLIIDTPSNLNLDSLSLFIVYQGSLPDVKLFSDLNYLQFSSTTKYINNVTLTQDLTTANIVDPSNFNIFEFVLEQNNTFQVYHNGLKFNNEIIKNDIYSTGVQFPTVSQMMILLSSDDTKTFHLSEFVAYDQGALSQFIRQNIEGKIADKWGIRNKLPNTHPWYQTYTGISSLTYSPSSFTFEMLETFTSGVPTFTASTTPTFTISPSLPSGLSLNHGTGEISGRALETLTVQTFTITAKTNTTTVSANIDLTVTESLNYAPESISYNDGSNSFNFYLETDFVTLTPNVIGRIDTYSVSPTLPSGLSIDSSTGIISGIPLNISASQQYTITASNDVGSITLDLNISVSENYTTINPSRIINSFNNFGRYEVDRIIGGKKLRVESAKRNFDGTYDITLVINFGYMVEIATYQEAILYHSTSDTYSGINYDLSGSHATNWTHTTLYYLETNANTHSMKDLMYTRNTTNPYYFVYPGETNIHNFRFDIYNVPPEVTAFKISHGEITYGDEQNPTYYGYEHMICKDHEWKTPSIVENDNIQMLKIKRYKKYTLPITLKSRPNIFIVYRSATNDFGKLKLFNQLHFNNQPKSNIVTINGNLSNYDFEYKYSVVSTTTTYHISALVIEDNKYAFYYNGKKISLTYLNLHEYFVRPSTTSVETLLSLESNLSDIEIVEIVIYDDLISKYKKELIETILTHKYNISYILDITHPGYRVPVAPTFDAAGFTGSDTTNLHLLEEVNIVPPSFSNTPYPVIKKYAVSPSLPNGLVFDSNTGIITGTCLDRVDNVVYTISVSNVAGSANTTFTLNITDWVAGTPPKYIVYDNELYSYDYFTDPVTVTIKPTIYGDITSLTIEPTLPVELTLNTSTGEITGTISREFTATEYTITVTGGVPDSTHYGTFRFEVKYYPGNAKPAFIVDVSTVSDDHPEFQRIDELNAYGKDGTIYPLSNTTYRPYIDKDAFGKGKHAAILWSGQMTYNDVPFKKGKMSVFVVFKDSLTTSYKYYIYLQTTNGYFRGYPFTTYSLPAHNDFTSPVISSMPTYYNELYYKMLNQYDKYIQSFYYDHYNVVADTLGFTEPNTSYVNRNFYTFTNGVHTPGYILTDLPLSGLDTVYTETINIAHYGTVGEVRIYDDILTFEQFMEIENYLQKKWNTYSLPSTHLYYSLDSKPSKPIYLSTELYFNLYEHQYYVPKEQRTMTYELVVQNGSLPSDLHFDTNNGTFYGTLGNTFTTLTCYVYAFNYLGRSEPAILQVGSTDWLSESSDLLNYRVIPVSYTSDMQIIVSNAGTLSDGTECVELYMLGGTEGFASSQSIELQYTTDVTVDDNSTWNYFTTSNFSGFTLSNNTLNLSTAISITNHIGSWKITFNSLPSDVTGIRFNILVANLNTVPSSATISNDTYHFTIEKNSWSGIVDRVEYNKLSIGKEYIISPLYNELKTFRYYLDPPTLPSELEFDNTTGIISGYVDDEFLVEEYTLYYQSSDKRRSIKFKLDIDDNNLPAISYPDTLLKLYSNESVNIIPKVFGTNVTVTGNLPDGLILATDGTITGTPTQIQNVTRTTITATNTEGSFTENLDISIQKRPGELVPEFVFDSTYLEPEDNSDFVSWTSTNGKYEMSFDQTSNVFWRKNYYQGNDFLHSKDGNGFMVNNIKTTKHNSIFMMHIAPSHTIYVQLYNSQDFLKMDLSTESIYIDNKYYNFSHHFKNYDGPVVVSLNYMDDNSYEYYVNGLMLGKSPSFPLPEDINEIYTQNLILKHTTNSMYLGELRLYNGGMNNRQVMQIHEELMTKWKLYYSLYHLPLKRLLISKINEPVEVIYNTKDFTFIYGEEKYVNPIMVNPYNYYLPDYFTFDGASPGSSFSIDRYGNFKATKYAPITTTPLQFSIKYYASTLAGTIWKSIGPFTLEVVERPNTINVKPIIYGFVSFSNSNIGINIGDTINITVNSNAASLESDYWYEIEPSLPEGLSFNSDTGSITGKVEKYFDIELHTITLKTVYNYSDYLFHLYTFTINENTLIVDPMYDDVYYINLSASTIKPLNTQYNIQYTILPELSNGLQIDQNTGIITGTPTQEFEQEYIITVTKNSINIESTIKIVVIDIPLQQIEWIARYHGSLTEVEITATVNFIKSLVTNNIIDKFYRLNIFIGKYSIFNPIIRNKGYEFDDYEYSTYNLTYGVGWNGTNAVMRTGVYPSEWANLTDTDGGYNLSFGLYYLGGLPTGSQMGMKNYNQNKNTFSINRQYSGFGPRYDTSSLNYNSYNGLVCWSNDVTSGSVPTYYITDSTSTIVGTPATSLTALDTDTEKYFPTTPNNGMLLWGLAHHDNNWAWVTHGSTSLRMSSYFIGSYMTETEINHFNSAMVALNTEIGR